MTGGHTCIQQKPDLGKLGSKVQIHGDWKVQTFTCLLYKDVYESVK